MSKTKIPHPKHHLDNRSNQLNPHHPEFYRSRSIDLPLAECLAVRKQLPGPLPDEYRRQFQANSQPK